ncbi:MAG TPA: Ig-like domain-containing protein, partial [Edaphobacter sp.]
VTKIDGATLTITNKGQLVLPATVEVKFKDGTSTRTKLPVETWLSKSEYVWSSEDKKPIASVTIDPDHKLPDDDRTNNAKSAE